MVFLAVISGNPRSAVEQYAKSHKFEWPILVDENRETEKSLGFTISLQHIYECFIVDPAGKVRRAAGEDKAIADEINKLLPQARMLFDGIAIPEKL